MLALLATALLAQSPTLTLSEPGARLPVVLEAISGKVGMRLKAGAEMENEVICLRLHDAPAEQVLSKIAEVTGGEWSSSGDTRVLKPSAAEERQYREELLKARRDGLRNSEKEIREQLKRVPVIDEQSLQPLRALVQEAIGKKTPDEALEAKMQQVFPGDPADRLLVKLLDMIPEDDWIGLPNATRVVYAVHPTSMQRELPGDAEQAMTDFVAESRALDRVKNLFPPSQNGSEGDIASDYDPTTAAKLLLTIEITATTQTADFRLLAIGRDGKRHFIAELDGGSEEDEGAKSDSASVMAAETSKIPLPDDTVTSDFLKLINIARRPDPATDEDRIRKWLPVLVDPMRTDPLSFTTGRRLVAAAGLLHENLVADIPDYDFIATTLRKEPPRPRTIGSFFDELERLGGVKRANGWITLRDFLPAVDRAERIRRTELKVFLTQCLQARTVTIEDAADHAAELPPVRFFDALSSLYADTILRADDGAGFGPLGSQADGLRLYGLLGRDLRDHLEKGATVSIANAPTALREELERRLFGRDPDKSWNAFSSEFEPTEAFPNGLPPTGSISVTNLHQEMFGAAVRDVGGREISLGSALPLDQLAKNLGAADASGHAERLAAFRRTRLFKGFGFTFRIQYAPGLAEEFAFNQITPGGDQIVDFANMPAAFNEAFKQAKIDAANIKKAQVGASGPPPPQR